MYITLVRCADPECPDTVRTCRFLTDWHITPSAMLDADCEEAKALSGEATLADPKVWASWRRNGGPLLVVKQDDRIVWVAVRPAANHLMDLHHMIYPVRVTRPFRSTARAGWRQRLAPSGS